jgi:hypothetical protein
MRRGFYALGLMLLISLFGATACFGDNIVVNGGFETGNFSGWTLVGGGCVGVGSNSPSGCTGVDVNPGPHSGKYAAYLGPNAQIDALSQTQLLSTIAGRTYQIDFYLANTSLGGATSPNLFTASFGSNPLLSLTNAGSFGFTQFHYLVTATTSTTSLSFNFRQDPAYWVLDDVSVQAVSEPFSLLLLGAGMAGIGTYVRRRQ